MNNSSSGGATGGGGGCVLLVSSPLGHGHDNTFSGLAHNVWARAAAVARHFAPLSKHPGAAPEFKEVSYFNITDQ